MPFKKFVQVGRVAFAVHGPAKGKLVAIIDVIDYNRVLVDGPCTNVPRQEYMLNNLTLTKYKINIQHGQHSKHVKKAWKQAKIIDKWQSSSWLNNLWSKKKKQSLTDLERFKVVTKKRVLNSEIKRRVSINKGNLKLEKQAKRLIKLGKVKKLVVKKPLQTQRKNLEFKRLRLKGFLTKDGKKEYKKNKQQRMEEYKKKGTLYKKKPKTVKKPEDKKEKSAKKPEDKKDKKEKSAKKPEDKKEKSAKKTEDKKAVSAKKPGKDAAAKKKPVVASAKKPGKDAADKKKPTDASAKKSAQKPAAAKKTGPKKPAPKTLSAKKTEASKQKKETK